jgi:hypothetical protein
LVDAEKEVGFAGGVRFDKRGKVKAGEDRVGEKVGGDFDKLGLGKRSTEVVVGEVNGPEEGVARHDRVEEKIHAGKRSYVGGGGARGLEAVTASGTANATVHAGAETS